jgi:uncharacterized RDD family membrane protein YckC
METIFAPEIDLLLDQLNSPNAGDRRMAAASLGKLDCRDERVRSALEFVANNDQDSFARSEAIYALEDLGFPIPNQASPPENEQLNHTETYSGIEGKQFGIRAVAYIIDGILLNLAYFGLMMTITMIVSIGMAFGGREFAFNQRSTQCQDLILGVVFSTLTFTIFEWLFGATPGKLILGMRVVKESGEPCDFQSALIRAVLRLIDGFLFGVPAYASMKHPLYQRIGDKSAKTIVVSAKSDFIQRPRQWYWFLVAAVIYLGLNALVATVQIVTLLR